MANQDQDGGTGFFDGFVSFELGIPPDDLPPDHETDGAPPPNEEDGGGEPPAPELDDPSEDTPEEATPPTPPDDDADDRVQALYELAKAEGMIDEIEGFKGRIDDLPTFFQQLSIQAFNGVIDSFDPLARDLVDFMITQRGKLDVDSARQFFDQYVAPAASFQVPSTDDQAMEYLKVRLKDEGLFPSEAKLQRYLDDLLEDGSLLEVATKRASADKQVMDSQRQQLIEQAKADEQAALQRQQEFYQSVISTIDGEQWSPAVKDNARKHIDPRKVQEVNEKIRSSPKAVAQLALLYSYYDEKEGVFDLRAFAEQKASKKVEGERKDLEAKRLEALARMGRRSAEDDKPVGSLFDQLAPANDI